MEYKYKLSICMMVKNEEKYLEQSLNSLKPFFENLKTELIIVDTGSKDRTVEIAKRFTENVYLHDWNDDFGEMRNKTIQYAKGEWLLMLDGDEIFTKAKPLIKFLKSSDSKNYNSISIIIKNITNTNNEEGLKAEMLRLFRNKKDFKYKGKIHEQPMYKQPIYISDSEILHYGYLSTDDELMEYKFKRNTELLKKELKKDPYNIYYLFQLSLSYAMYNKYKESLKYILKSYEALNKKKCDHRKYLYVYNQLAKSYYQNGKFKEIDEIADKLIELEDQFIDFYYYIAVAQGYIGKNEQSIKNFERYLELLSKEGTSHEFRNFALDKSTLKLRDNVYLNLAKLYEKEKQYLKSIEYVEKIESDHYNKEKIKLLTKGYLKLKNHNQLVIQYNKLLEMEESNKEILHLYLETIENYVENNIIEKRAIRKLFSEGNSDYVLLNKTRNQIELNKVGIQNELIQEIKNINFENLPMFFADMIYALMINEEINVGNQIFNLKLNKIQMYVNYLINKYQKDVKHIFIKYLNLNVLPKKLEEIRFQKELIKGLLINNIIDFKKEKELYYKYLSHGTNYIKYVYNSNLIKNEIIYDIKDNEDIFLIYIYLADKIKEKDKILYIKYLKKALKIYPIMKDGIELMLFEYTNELKQTEIDKSNELIELKYKMKEKIKILLDQGNAKEVLFLIDEYFKIELNDIEMLLLKSEIYLNNHNEVVN